MCSCCAYALSSQRALSHWPPHWPGARVRHCRCPTGCRFTRRRRRRCRLAVRIRSAGRRCAHGARPDLPDALLAHGAAGKPIGDRSPRTASCRRRCRSLSRMPEHGMFDNPPPDIQPNPVAVVLQPAPPPHRMAPRPKPHQHRRAGRRAAAPADLRWIAVPTAATATALANAPFRDPRRGKMSWTVRALSGTITDYLKREEHWL